MTKFNLGQRVKVHCGSGEPFCGRVTEIRPPKTFYRVEATDKDGKPFFMVIEEDYVEPENEIDIIDKTTCLIDSLKSLAFHIGGTHVAGMVEEAERAARNGMVVKYE